MQELNINGSSVAVDVDPATPLLWVIREQLGLTGSKYGCGIGVCGACTVHVDGRAVRACSLPVAAVTAGQAIVTIEGLSTTGVSCGSASAGSAQFGGISSRGPASAWAATASG